MLVALTRAVSPSLAQCELTHLARSPIDVPRATAQHSEYERVLGRLGLRVQRVPAAPELPDAVFIEDAAVVLDELAVITRPGARSRQAETPGVAEVLSGFRKLHTLTAPATLDGGDVLRLGRTLFVGRSGRSNEAGIQALRTAVSPFGYSVAAVEFTGALHLKSAVTQVAEGLLLLNPAWVSPAVFEGSDWVAVDPEEPYGANALRVADTVVYASAHSRTGARLAARGLRLAAVDCSELAKAEGGVTCCSLIFEERP